MSLFVDKYRCEYVFNLVSTFSCPNLLDGIIGFIPKWISNKACECLRSWILILLTLALDEYNFIKCSKICFVQLNNPEFILDLNIFSIYSLIISISWGGISITLILLGVLGSVIISSPLILW